MAKTQNEITRQVTLTYLASLNPNTLPSAASIEESLIAATNKEFNVENAGRSGTHRINLLKRLTFWQVAQILIGLHRVRRIAPSGRNTDRDLDMVAIYVDKGDDEGIYATSEDHIRSVARFYNSELTINEFREIMTVLREEAPRMSRSHDRDLIAVNNGIFDFRTKELKPFNPETIFLSKARVDYDPAALSPGIQTPDGDTWEVEEWVATLSPDPEVVELLWEIMSAIVRPMVRWNKSAWFYSEKGNNGKGTLVELMRNLVGTASYASIPIADFGKDFLLEPLTRASAILVDENDVGSFIDRAANLKAIITNDVISINRKYKTPIAYQFWGFMVQCLNEYPKIRDRSESFYRRQCFVPFVVSFTGAERRYIKDDYVGRDSVLQYVLKRVLHMDHYVLSEPEATRLVLEDYKVANDPVRAFWEEFEDTLVWDLVPFTFLYDLFKAWFVKNNPSGKLIASKVFIKDLLQLLPNSTIWHCPDHNAKIRTARRLNQPEVLIAQYDLRDWASTTYTGTDPQRIGKPSHLAVSYRGIQRLPGAISPALQPPSDEED
ncbi:phage/plasmid primase, P4 family [Microbacterium sp. SL62]|uniref:DNA primase family protein n=1 Tax=Microbacterium sp. SL62 TaxID=2995139 RepID=UPI002273D6D6|nr:phage/plasmid primase, P4 family [Microbacterium sp. SL62]MCY1718548.1 phage/plasmid primase, P4 family [Microbacterium sp. SL62]